MITKDDILKFAKSILENPDLSDNSNPVDSTGNCSYFDHDTGRHCLVGYWLHHEAGIDNDALSIIESKTADYAIKYLIHNDFLSDVIDNNAALTLYELQQAADAAIFDYDEDAWVCPTWGGIIKDYFYSLEMKK